MSSPPPLPPDPASQPIFTDEILGEIFLRLDSAADLARTSAACTTFLRVIRFLRRNRSLYCQPVVGFLDYQGLNPVHLCSFYHAQPPHRSASAARDLAEAADFTCSFLPDPGSWMIQDATGGRLLLASGPDNTVLFSDLVVCDPLQRRYVRIPPIPADLTSAHTTPRRALVPSFFASTGAEEESSFRVTWILLAESEMTAFIFSSATGQWRTVSFEGLKYNELSDSDVSVVLTSCPYHPHISLSKASELFSEVIMLDTHKMVFSVVRTPLEHHRRQRAIIEAGEGRLGFLTIVDGKLDLYFKAWQDNSVSAEEWHHEKTIPIPLPNSQSYSISFSGTGSGYLLIQAIPPHSVELEQMPQIHYFTLHVKTLLVERLCMLNKRIGSAHVYANFLPPLSLPSV